MSPAAVSVLDDTGKLLSTPADGSNSGTGGADAQQLQYVQQIEQIYTRRVLDILEPVVGRQNVKAQVTAEVDFSQTEQTSESHKPNQSPDSSAIRSQQLVESTNGGPAGAPAGVPGATSNQPPAPSSAPVNGPAQTLAAAGGASSGATANSRRESIINYEVDKTVKVVKAGTGVVKRLSAAVVLNNKVATDERGRTTSTPLTEQQLEKMTALVRETIGFSQDRGDSVNLMNAPFAQEKITVSELPIWKQPEMQDLARSFAWPVGLLLFAVLVLLGVIKPAMKALTRPAQNRSNQLNATVADRNERALLPSPGRSDEPHVPTAGELALEDARKLTRDNPGAVASIVKTWINGEAAA
jgi:flagellar M-ring protein FliF